MVHVRRNLVLDYIIAAMMFKISIKSIYEEKFGDGHLKINLCDLIKQITLSKS